MRKTWASLVVVLCMSLPLSAASAATPTPTTQVATTQPVAAPAQPSGSEPAAATTTAPQAEASEPNWQQVLDQLSQRLVGQDLAPVRSALRSDVVVRAFASDSTTTIERLVASTTQCKLLGTHAYPKLPATLASDLAADFHGAGDLIPESVLRDMTPVDSAAEKRANETAAAWVQQVLQPTHEQPIGVIVFWPTSRRLPEETMSRRAIFVLVKATQVHGSYVIQQLTFGDPLELPR